MAPHADAGEDLRPQRGAERSPHADVDVPGTSNTVQAVLFDWGDTLMEIIAGIPGAMACWPRVALIPGVTIALEGLADKLACYVASNAADSDAELVAAALERVGIRRYFRGIWTQRELGRTKSDPAYYTAILHHLQLPGPACVMVGDSYRSDVVPAKRAGLHTIWLRQAGDERTAPDADMVIRSMLQLPHAVARLELGAFPD